MVASPPAVALPLQLPTAPREPLDLALTFAEPPAALSAITGQPPDMLSLLLAIFPRGARAYRYRLTALLLPADLPNPDFLEWICDPVVSTSPPAGAANIPGGGSRTMHLLRSILHANRPWLQRLRVGGVLQGGGLTWAGGMGQALMGAGCLAGLRSLSLAGVAALGDDDATALLKGCPQLVRLSLAGCARVGDRTADVVARYLPALEVLDMERTAVTDAAAVHFAFGSASPPPPHPVSHQTPAAHGTDTKQPAARSTAAALTRPTAQAAKVAAARIRVAVATTPEEPEYAGDSVMHRLRWLCLCECPRVTWATVRMLAHPRSATRFRDKFRGRL
ncbi:hypothetical protein PAPYR_9079 [Paratrimastix pyriformis]|uniref:Uncharacterized protein n=1 Tax=Paratrimastix pyriformis TaxID=342808 RepID=A0ABQ8UER7_9EUKA|nr:hypothetical protein PAPYR_9079 [Paratrimastix pyriformis]